MATLQPVHFRVNDARTGKPTPCRVRFTDSDGAYYPPLGRLAEFSTEVGIGLGANTVHDGKVYASIDGACEILLPPGTLHVEIHKGPEYRPIDDTIQLLPGKMALRLEIERTFDARVAGWFSGDCRAHFLSPHAALLESAAEDLAVTNLLVWETALLDDAPSLANIEAFSGQQAAVAMPDHLVAVNSLNVGPALQSLILLHSHRVVYPLSFDESSRWTLCDWADQCHRKKGLVIAADNLGPMTQAALDARKIDALYASGAFLEGWTRLLNEGHRLPLVAGSGKCSNVGVLGRSRVFAKLQPGAELTYTNWIEAIRQGRTFISTGGPLLFLIVDGHDVGAEIPAHASMQVRVEVWSQVPQDRVQIVMNGEVVASTQPTPGTFVFETTIVGAAGWISARCWGAASAAYTSATYIV